MWDLIYFTILKLNELKRIIIEKWECLNYSIRACFHIVAAIIEENYVISEILRKEEGLIRLKYSSIENLALKLMRKGFKVLDWEEETDEIIYRKFIMLEKNEKIVRLFMKEISITLRPTEVEWHIKQHLR